MKNLNDLAKEVTAYEGGQINLSIAQVKEVIKVLCYMIVSEPVVMSLLVIGGMKQMKKELHK